MTAKQNNLYEMLQSDSPIAYWKGELIYRDQFWPHVSHIAGDLPEQEFAINLCEDRYLFLVSFVACLLRGQTSLLPPSRAKKEIGRLCEEYSGCYQLIDNPPQNDFSREHVIQLDGVTGSSAINHEVDEELIAAIVFTSGSTGIPKASPKRWKDLVTSARKVWQQLELDKAGSVNIVATVPPQHMFGFEMSIVYPLINGACVSGERPFFPHDVKMSLARMQAPRVLVTTPVHLHVCSESNLEWPDINTIVSATAPLPAEVACLAEEKMNTNVLEIYGCSEVGAIATRVGTKEKTWNLLEGYKISEKMQHFWLTVPGSNRDIELPDQIKIKNKNQFTLIGRNSDLVNIGGKRGSIGDMTNKLKNLNGVRDGVFFVPDTSEVKRVRLVAIVSAPGVAEKDILAQLSEHVDEVFLPRPILKVDRLPYNEVGKLTKSALMAVLNQARDSQQLLETA